MRRTLLLLLTAGTVPLAAQWILSMMAGYVPHVEGEVYLDEEAIDPEPDDLLHIPEGGRLRTAQGRAEIMITPASYLRVGPGSTLRLVESGLLSAVVALESGAAVLDLSPGIEPGAVQVLLNDEPVELVKGGLYRFEASPEPLVRVLDGRADVGSQTVKSHRTLHLSEARVDKTSAIEPDDLDIWSRERSDVLAAELQKRREEGGGMSELERFWLDMALRRPASQPSSQPSASQQAGGRR